MNTAGWTRKLFPTLAFALLGAVPAVAQAPIQVAFVTPIQIVPETKPVRGLAINFIYGANSSVEGVDLGLINRTTAGQSSGLEWGFVNISEGSFKGFQWGWYNTGRDVNGLQLALVNYAEKIHGVQVGLINIIKTGGQFPIFPIVNWGK
jgi:hypothetical protein